MNAIYHAEIRHVRQEAPRYRFRHRTYLWLVDLDRPPRLAWWLAPLARFEARDHFGDPRRTIRQNLDAWLAERGVRAAGQVLMLTNARVLGHVFNPISLFWCHDTDGAPSCVVAEVHNTYGGRHCYLLRPDERGIASVAKDFYVSPFQRMGGHYTMRVPEPGARLAVTVALRQDGRVPLSATLHGIRVPASTGAVVRAALRRPLVTLAVSAAIRWHGIGLWLRRAPLTPRPSRKGVR